MTKLKANKRFTHKTKKTSSVHPHIEHIHTEISTLEEKLNTFEELEKSRELTVEEKTDKQATKTSLAQTQTILTKLTEPSMLNKVRSHQDIVSRDTREKDELLILSLLQLFYMMRLGQLGLFDFVQSPVASPKNISVAINDICDQMVGAAVYYATDKSEKNKSEKKLKALQLLKLFDRGAEDLITEDVSFKDLKQFIQHVWDHTVDETQLVKEEDNATSPSWAVLQFNNMMGPVQPVSVEDGIVEPQIEETAADQPLQPEETVLEQLSLSKKTVAMQSAEVNEPAKKDRNTKQMNNESIVSESSQGWDAVPIENKMDSWKKDVSWENTVTTTWSSCENGNGRNSSSSNSSSSSSSNNNGRKSKRWLNKSHSTAYDRNAESWDKSLSAEKYGWKTFNNTIEGDNWENTETGNNDTNWSSDQTGPAAVGEPVVVEQIIADSVHVTTPPASPKQQEPGEETRQKSNSDSNDDWRRNRNDTEFDGRSRGARGSGRGGNSRGGKFRGRGRGRGAVHGRGRGKGRGREYDSELQHQ